MHKDNSGHRASFLVVDVVDASETECRVRVQIELSPSHGGFTHAEITFLAPRHDSEKAIRERVCAKIRQETGLSYLPDELQSPVLEASSASNSVEEARLPGVLEETATALAEIATDAVLSNRARKRKGKKP